MYHDEYTFALKNIIKNNNQIWTALVFKFFLFQLRLKAAETRKVIFQKKKKRLSRKVYVTYVTIDAGIKTIAIEPFCFRGVSFGNIPEINLINSRSGRDLHHCRRRLRRSLFVFSDEKEKRFYINDTWDTISGFESKYSSHIYYATCLFSVELPTRNSHPPTKKKNIK